MNLNQLYNFSFTVQRIREKKKKTRHKTNKYFVCKIIHKKNKKIKILNKIDEE